MNVSSVSSFQARIEQRLQQRYPTAQPTVLQQLAIAKRILMDTSYGKDVLTTLQTQLSGMSLDAILTQVEVKEQGFSPRAEVIALLDRDTFMEHLIKKEQILDGGTPFDHGPYSHRLQWYILYQASKQQQLTMKPVELYVQLGEASLKDAKKENRTVWDDVFDFDAEARQLIDVAAELSDQEARAIAGFSSPEFLLAIVTSSSFPNGPLKQELQLTRLGQLYLGRESVFDLKKALAFALAKKAWFADMNLDLEKVTKELEGKSLEVLAQQYAEIDPAYKKALDTINS
ncbi:MAG TPA: LirA/MavJ family T4SS effector [Ktedonobacteraceae bacterium]|nr:LirA/MavJ family T4SS effector [Ktedonobacteraceae bacterium]